MYAHTNVVSPPNIQYGSVQQYTLNDSFPLFLHTLHMCVLEMYMNYVSLVLFHIIIIFSLLLYKIVE